MKHPAPALLLAACALVSSGLQASPIELRAPYGASYSIKLTSLKEARFKTTVKQRYDFSCGSAATATLLTYQYGHQVTEEDVFTRMYARGDKAKIR